MVMCLSNANVDFGGTAAAALPLLGLATQPSVGAVP